MHGRAERSRNSGRDNLLIKYSKVLNKGERLRKARWRNIDRKG